MSWRSNVARDRQVGRRAVDERHRQDVAEGRTVVVGPARADGDLPGTHLGEGALGDLQVDDRGQGGWIRRPRLDGAVTDPRRGQRRADGAVDLRQGTDRRRQGRIDAGAAEVGLGDDEVTGEGVVDHVVDRRLHGRAERREQGHDGGTDHQRRSAGGDAPGVAHRVAAGEATGEATGQPGAGAEHGGSRPGDDRPEDDEPDEHGEGAEPGAGHRPVTRATTPTTTVAAPAAAITHAGDRPCPGRRRAVDGDVAQRCERRDAGRLERRRDAGDERRQHPDEAGDDDRAGGDDEAGRGQRQSGTGHQRLQSGGQAQADAEADGRGDDADDQRLAGPRP